MITIKDIAKAAGVSPSTVSNVLNRRGNVSYKKICLVEKAAKEMGYRLNEAAAVLRSGQSKTIAVVLPNINSSAYAELYNGILLATKKNNYEASLYVSYNDPQHEKQLIQDIAISRAKIAIIVTSLMNAEKHYAQLAQVGIKCLFVERTSQDNPDYIGFDMADVAKRIANRILCQKVKTIGILTDMYDYPNIRLFVDTFSDVFSDHTPKTRINVVHTVPSQYIKGAHKLTEDMMPDAVIATNEQIAAALQGVFSYYQPKNRPEIYVISPTRVLPNPQYTCFMLNYRALGTNIVEHALHGEKKEKSFFPADGFVSKPDFPYVAKPLPIKMLTINSAHTSALRQLAPRIKREMGIDLQIKALSSEEMNRVVSHYGASGSFDMIRIAMSSLDAPLSRVFAPLDELSVDMSLVRDAMLPSLWGEYTTIDGVEYTLPADPSAMVLFYRRDLMENATLQRAFYEHYKRDLELPETYEELVQLSEFFDRRFRSDAITTYGTIISDRSIEYLAHLVSASPTGLMNDIQIDWFTKVIETHKKWIKSAYKEESCWWQGVVRQFSSGNSMFSILFANHAEILSNSPLSRISGRVGHAITPGRRPLLGGGVLGVTAASANKDAASDLLSWMFLKENSKLLALLSGTSPCSFAYEDEQLLDIYPWLKTVQDSLRIGSRRSLFDIPSESSLQNCESTIGFYAKNALEGIIDAKTAVESIRKELTKSH